MDTQAGAQFAEKTHQTTIDLQAGIIASHQDEIGRANVRITDQAAEIDRLNLVLADRQARIAKLMGEVVRAEIAAPAAPSEQVESSEGQQGTLSIERIVKNAILGNSHPCDDGYLMFLNEDEVTTVAWQVGLAARAAAPAAPLPAQPESLLIRAYNSGYKSGHHDTVEGQYTDIDQRDMFTYHADVVADMIADGTLAGAAPLPELTAPSIEQIELDIIENWLTEMSQPIGMDCCGQYQYTHHGLLGTETHCCGNGEPAFMDFAAFEKKLNERREVLVVSLSTASPSPAPAPTAIDDDEFYPPKAALKREDWDAKTRKPKVEPQDGLVLPPVAAPVSQHEACRTCGVEVGGQHAPDCVYEGEAMVGFFGKGAAGARKLVGYGPCKCVLSHYCGGQCNPVWADEATNPVPRMGGDTKTSDAESSPASRMGGITSKESAETAAPGASTEDKQ